MATILTTNGNIASTSSVSIASSGSTSLVVSGNPLVYLSSSNRVGVNTNNPSYTLDVNGDVNSSGNIRSVGVLAISASNIYAASISSSLLTSSGVLFYNSAGTAVLNNASKFFWDNTNNKLGIGTSSLNGLIHINANNTQTTNILAEKTVGSTAFSVVPWSSQVYIGAGVYQNAGGWVTQNGGSSLYQLLTMYPGNGVTWFAYGATGTNPASQVSLWNDSGSWISNVNSNNITGSVLGTASWATNSLTSSLLLGSVVSASYAGTASILLGSVISASYALTASYAANGGGSSASASYFSGAVVTASNISVVSTITAGTIKGTTSVSGAAISGGNFLVGGNLVSNVNFKGVNSNIIGSGSGTYGGNNNFSNAQIANTNIFGYQAAAQPNYNSGINNTFSGSNFFGYQAGANLQSANYNYAANSNFIGYQAGCAPSSAGNIVVSHYSNFFGYQAGYGTTGACNSIFIGRQAGFNDTVANVTGNLPNGNSSIAIGDYSAPKGFTNSITIGRGTGNSAAAQANIGNVLWINGINVAGTAASNTAITTAKVGIGTNAPATSLHVVGNISASSFTGSVFGTSSWSSNSLTASLLLGSVVSASYAGTASILLGSVVSASYALSASYAPGGASLTGGVTNYHPIWTSATTLGTSSVYQSGSNLAINNTTFNSVAPESLLVSSSNYNIIGAYANINNYAQLNLQNFSAGGVSSADIVATNNTGGELGNFIDMGINGSGFNSSIGGPNDSYLYSSGSNLFVGNASPNQNLYFFAGSTTNTSSMVLLSNGNFGIGTTQPSASLQVNGNISASSLTGSVLGTSSWSSNSLTASYVNASNVIGTVTSASYSLSASYAPTSIPSQINTTGVTASFTGSLVGNVTGTSSWATNSVSASVINTSNNSLYYFDLSSGSAGLQPTYTATNLTYNPSTSTLSGSLLNISGAGIYLTGSMIAAGSVTGSAFYFGSNTDDNNMTVSQGVALNINPRWALQIYNNIFTTFKTVIGSLNGGYLGALVNGVSAGGAQFASYYDFNNFTTLTTNISGSATFNTVGGSQGYNFQNSGSSALFISGSGRIGMGTTASLAPLHIQSSVVLATGSAGVLISQSLSQSAVTASQVYGLQINQTFINVAPNQIQTALKVNPTFTGSFTGSNTRNLIADFSTPTAGTQFSVTDVTSGSIYQVNDVSGLPIAEALSDWTFKLWNYPTVVLIKTGSKVAIGSNGVSVSPINPSASLYVSGSIASNGINISSSVLPNASGSIFYSASKLWVFTGTTNNYGAGAGWATASLSV